MADGFDGQIHIEVGPVEVVRLRTFDVRELRDRSVLEPGEFRKRHEQLLRPEHQPEAVSGDVRHLKPESILAKDRRTQGLVYSAWIFARCTMSRMRFKPPCVPCVPTAGGEPIGSSPWAISFPRTSGEFTALTISALSRSTIALGVASGN